MVIQKFNLYRSADKSLVLTVSDKRGNPLSLTNCKINMQARSPIDGLLLLDMSTDNGSIDVLGYLALITIRGDDTKRATWRNAIYDIIVTTPQGRRIPVSRGNITLIGNITE